MSEQVEQVEQVLKDEIDLCKVFGYSPRCPDQALVLHSRGSDAYRRNIRSAVRGLWTGAIDRAQFFDVMVLAIRKGQTEAFTEGSAACGILPAEWSSAEKLVLEQAIGYERQWIAGFATAIEQGSKAEGGKLGAMFQRSEIWIGRYEGLRDKAKAMTCQDRKLEWVLGATEKHCSSCFKLAGKVKRASYWYERGILPRVHGAAYLECQGFRCDCEFVVTDKPMSKGPLPSLP